MTQNIRNLFHTGLCLIDTHYSLEEIAEQLAEGIQENCDIVSLHAEPHEIAEWLAETRSTDDILRICKALQEFYPEEVKFTFLGIEAEKEKPFKILSLSEFLKENHRLSTDRIECICSNDANFAAILNDRVYNLESAKNFYASCRRGSFNAFIREFDTKQRNKPYAEYGTTKLWNYALPVQLFQGE